MNDLPFDVFNLILDQLKCITDIRNLSRTNDFNNKLLSNKIIEYENRYKLKYEKLNFVNYFGNYCVENFTIEIVLDNYYNLLKQHYFTKRNKIMCPILAFRGNIELLKKAVMLKCPLNDYTILCAAYEGHLKIIQYLEPNVSCDLNTIVGNAAEKGNLEIIKWAHTKSELLNTTFGFHSLSFTSSKYGHIHVLKWIITKYDIQSDFVKLLEVAIPSTLQWFHDSNYLKHITNESFCDILIKYGTAETLTWAISNNYIISENYVIMHHTMEI
jgi:hypothetical protein